MKASHILFGFSILCQLFSSQVLYANFVDDAQVEKQFYQLAREHNLFVENIGLKKTLYCKSYQVIRVKGFAQYENLRSFFLACQKKGVWVGDNSQIKRKDKTINFSINFVLGPTGKD